MQRIVTPYLSFFVPYSTRNMIWACRMGGWVVAQSPIIGTTITLERLRKRGYVSMFSLYQKVSVADYKNSLFPMI